MNAEVQVSHDVNIDFVPAKFHFKKVKNDVTGDETKRPTVEIEKFPVPSVEGLAAIFNAGGKGLDLLLEVVRDQIMARGRDIVNGKEDITAENFPYDQLSWDVIANLPKAERRGGGISAEVWEEFAKDYAAIMPAATGKPEDKIALQASIFLKKLQPVKTRKDALAGLGQLLGIYVNSSPNAEQFAEPVEFLLNKIETLLNTSEADLLANLGV